MEITKARQWLRTQVETAVQLSNKPPKIAVWGVVLELPGDVLEMLQGQGTVYGFAGYHWFDYDANGKIVCVPIKKV